VGVTRQATEDDRLLLARCLTGDRQAWERLISDKSRLVYYAIRRTFQSKAVSFEEEEIEDLHNEVFTGLFANGCHKLRSFEGRGGCTLASWIRLIATRTTLTYLSRSRRAVSARSPADDRDPLDSIPDEAPAADEALAQQSDLTRLQEAVDALSPDDRLFITLHFEREMALPEVATILSASINALYSRKHRIVKRLRAAMEEG
jgi:RNA polymerase sigma-70 factor (ECF subfamily)